MRALGATAANEAIVGWLEGVADGCPELCTEFPNLKNEDATEPLTILYSVGAEDGSRAEIARIDFEAELTEAVASIKPVGARQRSAARLASRLRALADRLEAVSVGRSGI